MATKKPTSGAKKTASSPRITVLIGQVKKKIGGKDTNVNVYSRMKKDVADALGLKATTPIAKSSSGAKAGAGKRTPVPPRGSVGSGSISVILTDGKRYAFPVPSGITLNVLIAFLQKNVKNAQSFVTKNGVTRSLAKAK